VDRPDWKVVLHREARSIRELLDRADAFIMTTSEAMELTAPRRVPDRSSIANLVGAIELSVEENLLAQEQY